MYALLFRNRWFALMWAVLMIVSAVGIATRGLTGIVGEAEAGPSTAAVDSSFARWAADEPAAPVEKEATDGKQVEVRVYHAPPQDGSEDDFSGEKPDDPAQDGGEPATQQ